MSKSWVDLVAWAVIIGVSVFLAWTIWQVVALYI